MPTWSVSAGLCMWGEGARGPSFSVTPATACCHSVLSAGTDLQPHTEHHNSSQTGTSKIAVTTTLTTCPLKIISHLLSVNISCKKDLNILCDGRNNVLRKILVPKIGQKAVMRQYFISCHAVCVILSKERSLYKKH